MMMSTESKNTRILIEKKTEEVIFHKTLQMELNRAKSLDSLLNPIHLRREKNGMCHKR